MKELIKIEERNKIQTVDARKLHEFVQSKQEFSAWIKNRIEKFGFIENSDFLITLSESTGGRPSTEYFLSVDMAKELAMVENNDKGREIRQYFIAIEKTYKKRILDRQQLRNKSKAVRNSFTDTLRSHGYCKPGHYIQTTKQMKSALDITCKKDKMNNIELKAITAAELLSEINIEKTEAIGFQEVNPICVNCSNLIAQAIDNKNQIVRR